MVQEHNSEQIKKYQQFFDMIYEMLKIHIRVLCIAYEFIMHIMQM